MSKQEIKNRKPIERKTVVKKLVDKKMTEKKSTEKKPIDKKAIDKKTISMKSVDSKSNIKKTDEKKLIPTQIAETIDGFNLTFHTSYKVFSPAAIDLGTKAMLRHVELKETDKVLDLGCGYGIVGILMAKKLNPGAVVMCDVSEKAVELSKLNAMENGVRDIAILQSNGLKEIEDRDFTLILSNPPYHTDFSVAKGFIEDGFRHLVVGGRMFMVTKRLDWYKNKMTSVFGGVKVYEDKGYYVFEAEKRPRKKPLPVTESKQKTASKKLKRRHKL